MGGNAKRRRQKANKRAKQEAELEARFSSLPELSMADLDALLVEVTVKADCEHASTRTAADQLLLIKCGVGADAAGGCPVACERYEKRPADGGTFGIGMGAG